MTWSALPVSSIKTAFRMTSVREVDENELTETRRDLVAMLTALEGHRECTFTLQWLAYPALADGYGGSLEVSVIVAIPSGTTQAGVEEISDDVSDVLNGPPGLWTFERVTAAAELDRILHPFEPNHLAEVARREEPLPGSDMHDGGIQIGQYL